MPGINIPNCILCFELNIGVAGTYMVRHWHQTVAHAAVLMEQESKNLERALFFGLDTNKAGEKPVLLNCSTSICHFCNINCYVFFSQIIRHQRAACTASYDTSILMHSGVENLQTFHATIRHAQLLVAHEPHDT